MKPDFQEITKILKLFEDEKSKTVGKAILLNAGFLKTTTSCKGSRRRSAMLQRQCHCYHQHLILAVLLSGEVRHTLKKEKAVGITTSLNLSSLSK